MPAGLHFGEHGAGGPFGIGQHVGSIEPGKLADFAILTGDPLAVTIDDLRSIRVEDTWVDGAPVDWSRL